MYATDHMDGRIDKSVTGDCGAHGGDASLGDDDTSINYDGKTIAWDYQEYNSIYSRDLSHNKKEVREFSRAYLTWMRDSIGYDGFRWDFMKGISGQHLFDYLRASAPRCKWWCRKPLLVLAAVRLPDMQYLWSGRLYDLLGHPRV